MEIKIGRLFYSNVDGLSPEAKLLLFYMLSDVSKQQIYRKPLVYMAAKYCFSRGLIVKCKEQLIAAGIITLLRVDQKQKGQRGRPVCEYWIDFELLDTLLGRDFFESNQDVLHRVLKLSHPVRHKLKPANRFFMMLLVGKAGRCGIVEGVGVKDLCSWMGCSESRLQSIVRKLVSLDYLCHYIPGGRSPLLGKYKAIYFTNFSKIEIKTFCCVGEVDINSSFSLQSINTQPTKVLPVSFLDYVGAHLTKNDACKISLMHMDFRAEQLAAELLTKDNYPSLYDTNAYIGLVRKLFVFENSKFEERYLNLIAECMAKQVIGLIEFTSSSGFTSGGYEVRYLSNQQRQFLCFRGSLSE
ncbi:MULTISPECIES: hypothetical protein [Vibrio]|uniref:Uncharacterized protein n=1 Tax=Vibrio splendidus TaxID=29497 RepID=A0A2T5EC59_VIBSP|nr:hypothetical protein [Vibrio splendidus]NWJ63651.1 hypothetical protein [Vibrio parahaemolyticus]NWK17322.1 hypothetical protein [Vibrio parahaemolyticus]OEE61378.1 hypothetical protein A147_20415 [Vibrio splendidus FF-6]PTP16889.1 hypothetical protein CWO36_18090 [Vibrio splendidus]